MSDGADRRQSPVDGDQHRPAMKGAGVGIALAILVCHCTGAQEEGDRPSAALRTQVVLKPSGASFCVPDHWLRRYRRSRDNIYLTRQELEAARSVGGEWDSQFSAVVNTVLPFENCAVHAGAEGWGGRGVSYGDLQMRAYIGRWRPEEVRTLVNSRGLPLAGRLSARSRPPPRKEASAKGRQAGLWQVDTVAFDLFFGDYGGTATIDFYTRTFGGSTAVLVFMYVDMRRPKPTIPGQISTIVDSFSWPTKAADGGGPSVGRPSGPARREAEAPSAGVSSHKPRLVVVSPPGPPDVADLQPSLPADPLGEVMWRILPGPVRSVYVGPDGRVWLQLHHYGRREAGAVRENIEGEFDKPMPRISGSEPVLFEPDGRAWFRSGYNRTLSGYDGKGWVEHEVERGRYFVGNCPGHGRARGHGYNAFIMGRAFFIGSHGVYCFDGERWSYEPFTEGRSRRTELWPEPDRLGLIALTHGQTESALWRWREGEWVRLTVFVGDHADRPSASAPGVSRGREGAWLLYRGSSLRFLPFGAADAPGEPGPTPLGDYATAEAFLLHYDAGDVIVGAGKISKGERELGPGVLVCRADGTVRRLECDGLVEARAINYAEYSGPLVVRKDGRLHGVWFAGSPDGAAPRLLDVASRGPVQFLPDLRFHWLHAALPDGGVVVSAREVGNPSCGALAIYRPGRPDNRRVLKTERMRIKRGLFCVAPDGTIWTETPEDGVVRFDGTGWRSVPALREWRDVRFFLPGCNGEMLLGRDGEFGFLSGEELFVDRSLPDLVRDHHGQMVKAFSGCGRKNPWHNNLDVVPDKSGNIWLLYWRELRVLTGGSWLRARRALSDDGSAHGVTEYITALGDGNKVYVTDLLSRDSRGTSFYGEVLDGTLVFEPAPHTTQRTWIRFGVRDGSGALWLPRRTAKQVVSRVAESGLVQEIEDSGWPLLCDAGGNVWLGKIRGKPPYRFNVWSGGRLVRSLDVPGAEEYQTRMFSDRPGSVYAWTRAGLCHLTTRQPGDASTFALDTIYFPDGVGGHFMSCQYSKLGYAVVSSYASRGGGRQYFLYAISLP